MTEPNDPSKAGPGPVFAFFNEVGIINQLSTAMLAQALPDGVHPSHFATLNHLFRVGNGTTPVRIAAAMQVTKTTMSHTIKVLGERGFIDLQPDPEDGRAKQVFLTDKGRAFRNDAIQNVAARFGPVFEDEHIELMARMLDDLRVLRAHMDANR